MGPSVRCAGSPRGALPYNRINWATAGGQDHAGARVGCVTPGQHHARPGARTGPRDPVRARPRAAGLERPPRRARRGPAAAGAVRRAAPADRRRPAAGAVSAARFGHRRVVAAKRRVVGRTRGLPRTHAAARGRVGRRAGGAAAAVVARRLPAQRAGAGRCRIVRLAAGLRDDAAAAGSSGGRGARPRGGAAPLLDHARAPAGPVVQRLGAGAVAGWRLARHGVQMARPAGRGDAGASPAAVSAQRGQASGQVAQGLRARQRSGACTARPGHGARSARPSGGWSVVGGVRRRTGRRRVAGGCQPRLLPHRRRVRTRPCRDAGRAQCRDRDQVLGRAAAGARLLARARGPEALAGLHRSARGAPLPARRRRRGAAGARSRRRTGRHARAAPRRPGPMTKRMFDLLLSTLGLVLLSPAMLLIALAVTPEHDPRITRVGRWLRHYRLDELPQLIDVLRGAMSLVGPRPELPRFVDRYPAELRAAVLAVRPGITDPASLAHLDESALLAGSADPERDYVEKILAPKLRLQARYAARATLRSDIAVLGRTLAALVRR